MVLHGVQYVQFVWIEEARVRSQLRDFQTPTDQPSSCSRCRLALHLLFYPDFLDFIFKKKVDRITE